MKSKASFIEGATKIEEHQVQDWEKSVQSDRVSIITILATLTEQVKWELYQRPTRSNPKA